MGSTTDLNPIQDWASKYVSSSLLQKTPSKDQETSKEFGGRLYTTLTGKPSSGPAKLDVGKATFTQLLFNKNKYDTSLSLIVEKDKLQKVNFIQILFEKIRRFFGFEDRTLRVAAKIQELSRLIGVSSPTQRKIREIPLPTVSAAHQKQVQSAITTFAHELCAKIAANNTSSFAISPVSIVAALGMTLHVIKKENQDQFLEKIGLNGLSVEQAHNAIATALDKILLPDDFEDGEIAVAQGFAVKPSIKINPSLQKLAVDKYNAKVIISENLQEEVNKWVVSNTNDKIKTILDDNLNDCVLLNAIYLAFKWTTAFEKPSSGWTNEDFTCADGTKHQVTMMHQENYFKYAKGESFKMLEIPYKSPEGRNLSQVIFLPNKPEDLSEIESRLTAAQIKFLRENSDCKDVSLKMPKTKAEATFELLDLLKEMGLPLDAFDQSILPKGRIDEITHKTFVSNDEKGTEAAAVTAVGMITESAMVRPEPITFHMDRAYAYLIMDGDTMLFRGRISDKGPLLLDV